MSREGKELDIQRGVVDRISNGWAVILVGEKEQERKVREDELPDGVREGSIVKVRASGLHLEVVGSDDTATEAKRTEIRGRLDRLKDTRSKRRFDKSS